jgi:hypothetical protein
MKKFMKKKHRAPKKHSWLKKIGVKGNYVFKMVCSIMYTPNWRGRKMRESDGIGWNWFHHVPLHSIHFLNIQTMESHLIPLHSIPFHLIPPIQTKPKGSNKFALVIWVWWRCRFNLIASKCFTKSLKNIESTM